MSSEDGLDHRVCPVCRGKMKLARVRTATTLSESLFDDMALPLAGPTNESEAVNSAPVLSSLPKVSTYQCLNCKEVMTVKDWAGSGSYFEWLMSRPKSK